jgi:hypothetical protein
MFFIVYQNRNKVMRKNLVRAVIALAAIVVVGGMCLYVSGCSPQRRWSDKQRKEAREMLREWREIAYLNALTEAEFDLFSAEVADMLEERWPSYVEFIEMPMVGDSVEVVVVAAIVSDIKANANNMRRLFPYDTLVSSGVLPAGLTAHQQKEYYMCLANGVTNVFGSVQNFVWGAINSALDDVVIAHMLRDCAVPFWE